MQKGYSKKNDENNDLEVEKYIVKKCKSWKGD